jgi:hypothetical protein
MPCIFCRSHENLTDEHVFPAFMGGNLVVPNGSCETCNNIFGTSEAAIKEATTPLLNLLRIENRYGKVPNAPLNVKIRDLDMKSLPGFMDGAGNIQLRDFVMDVVDDDGKKRRQGFFLTKEAGEKFAERQVAKGGKTIEREVPKEIVIEADYTQEINFAFTVNARRVVAKIALTAIAFEYGIQLALSPQFDSLRAVRDEGNLQRLPVRIFANANIVGAWLRTPYQHSVLCYLSAGMKKGWALVTLFGGLSYIVEVTPAFSEPQSRQFSMFYDANSKSRANHVLLADEQTLIGHVLSRATTFESPEAVDEQWYPVVASFCSGKGTTIERMREKSSHAN